MRSIYCFVFIWFLFYHLMSSQELNFFHYGLEDGISQQTIRCIEKDARGFIWIGTQDGLNRFDGHSFKVFRHSDHDTLAVKGKFINDILENSDGTIWVATANHGVSYYDPNKDVFIRTTIQDGNCSSLSKDDEGNIYATFLDRAIVKFKKNKGVYEPKKMLKDELSHINFSSSFIFNRKLFLGTTTGSIFEIDLEHNKLVRQDAFNEIGIIDELIFTDNHLLMGTSRGLYTLNSDNELSIIDLRKVSNQFIENIVVETITTFEDKLYVGTDNGLFLLNEFSTTSPFKNVVHYAGDKSNGNSITSNRVYDILVDDALLWIGTNNLDVASIQPPVFKTINTFSAPRINNNYVFSIFRTPDYLFIGTRDGLNCIDNQGKVTLITKENTNQRLAFNVIRGMTLDHQNNLWLATTKGVSVISLNNFDPKKPIINSIYNEPGNESSLSENKTRSIFVDQQNTIWIATYGGGLNRFTGNLESEIYTFERYLSSTSENSLSSNMVFHITQDASGTYWITSENGLNKLQFKNELYKNPNFERYLADSENSRALQSNTTLHSYIDKNNTLWIATQNGLHKYEKTTNDFTHYNEENGLSNTYVYAILEDQDQKLWVSTNDGLFRFDKKQELFTPFSLNDGVQSTEFNLGASFRDKDTNTLYFGGINGFNAFNPSDVSSLDAEGNLIFTELAINGAIINPVIAPKNLKNTISNVQTITLSHEDFPCVLKFSDIDLRPRKSTSFEYKLNSIDWNPTNATQEIQLLDLPKGEHILQVRGKSRAIIWKQEPLQLKINILPPWYKSNLAYLLYIITFFTLSYFYYKMRLQQQYANQEAQRLQDLDALKSRFITNITHEFRTPLTLILGYLGHLKTNPSIKEIAKEPLIEIEQNSENLLGLVNEMMDLAKLEQGKLRLDLKQLDIISYTKYLVESFSSMAEKKNNQLHFKSTINALMMDIDIEKYRQIISNLISNAIKFSNENDPIEIYISCDNEQLNIQVKDFGRGISPKALPHIFDRFYQSSNAKKIAYKGTGVGLALSKELIHLMQGIISVDSIENEGTTFKLQLPITNTAAMAEENEISIRSKSPYAIPSENKKPKNTEKRNRVLIVEDNPDISKFIASCLSENYDVIQAINGLKGLAKAEQKIPDIIITDVMMPKMDGLEMTQKLQENPATNHIPIMMLTAKAQLEDKLFGLQAGADAYLTKPFEKQELLVRVSQLIHKRKALQHRYSIKKIIELDKATIKDDKKVTFLDQAIKHIEVHLEDADYNALQLAKHLHISESQLYRKLKALTNKSTALFIRSVKLEKAKQLLENTDLSISEVAYATGFSNPNWFSKAFKAEFNCNPTQIRN
ncbi:MAG: hybrid sensor histidine kinase/response regulator transcription factor [bacterium]